MKWLGWKPGQELGKFCNTRCPNGEWHCKPEKMQIIVTDLNDRKTYDAWRASRTYCQSEMAQ